MISYNLSDPTSDGLRHGDEIRYRYPDRGGGLDVAHLPS